MVDLPLPDATPAPDAGDAAGRLVERVRAWQHRHPLARRIAASEVVGFGVIALPYGQALGPRGEAQALFHQPNLLPGLSHRALLAFAGKHAVRFRPGPPDWPLRQIERSDASNEAAPETRYLLTAAVNDAHPRSALARRLLIAPESPAIWGPRQWSRSRMAAAALAAIVVLALAASGLKTVLRRPAAGPVPAPAAVPAASIPASTAAASAPLAASPVAKATPAPAAPSVPLPAASLPAAVSPAASVAKVAPPASAPASASASAPAVVAPPRLLPMPHQKQAASSPAAPAASAPVVAAGTHYALVSAPAKKREEAEATLERVRKLLGPAIGTLQAQVMPSPEGFVVTIWPLPTEADAQRLAEVLARRGVPMKWLEF